MVRVDWKSERADTQHRKRQARKSLAFFGARLTAWTVAVAIASAGLPVYESSAQVVDPVADIPSLVGVKPILPDVSAYIRDPIAAQQLGKALFWDTQVGSDGQACATCHFHAGADIRTKNQTDPSVRNTVAALQNIFDARDNNAGIAGPNKQFAALDFPFHKLADINNRESSVIFDTNDVFSSQGTYAGDFVSGGRSLRQDLLTAFLLKRNLFRGRSRSSEKCNLTYSPFNPNTNPTGNPFHANGLIYRKVEPRQTPTTINAVFNFRQFWDGRANSQFNGVDPFGPRTFTPLDPATSVGNPDAAGAGILVLSGKALVITKPLIDNASLASQAVGPPLSDFEMSCAGKTFADLGAKLLPMRPLSTQVVHPQDSLFSKTPALIPSSSQTGLKTTYKALVEKAFFPKYWNIPGWFNVDPATGAITLDFVKGHTQEEQNFSLFWGLAIQAYEQLLVSDDSPFDHGPAAMNPQAVAGLAIFEGKGKCVACHNGPLLSGATVTSLSTESPKAIEGMLMGDGRPGIYDTGFYNIGVRPTSDDIGVGALDPYGFDLSFTRQFKWRLLNKKNKSVDRFDARPCEFATPIFTPCDNLPSLTDPASAPRDSVDGSFKVPILRNVGLNPPYFHNGGQATLKDVVHFYNRGGDRRGPLDSDTTGLATPTPFGVVNNTNLDPDIGDASATSTNNALGLTDEEEDDLVQFLLSLTDNRVACHSGVFDHPSLPIANGELDVAKAKTQQAKDIVVTLPAVGQQGLKVCFPNSGDIFGTLNTTDTRRLQDVFNQVIK